MSRVIIASTKHSIEDVRVASRIARSFSKENLVLWIGPPGFNFDDIAFNEVPIFLKSKYRLVRLFRLMLELFRTKADFIYSADPDAALVSALVARCRGAKSIFDIHEVFHEDILKLRFANEKKLAYKLLSKLIHFGMSLAIRWSDVVVAVGPSRIDSFKFNKSKLCILGHHVPVHLLTRERHTEIDRFSGFKILHGKATLSRNTKAVIEALDILLQRGHDIKLVMLGTETEYQEFLEKLTDRQRSAIIPLPRQSHQDMFKVMNSCDLGIIAYGRRLGVRCVPNRFFELYTSGIPMIFPEYAEDLDFFVRSFSLNEERIFKTDMEDAVKVADTVENIANLQRRVIRVQDIEQGFLWDANFKRLTELLK